ncbi:MAG: type II CRISPR RNA-guided endonuclease Cas9 [Phycisphaerae bacterium]
MGEYLAGFAPRDGDKKAHVECSKERRWVRNQGALGSDPHRSFSRQMYKDEVENLWSVQSRFHPDVLSGDLKQKVYSAIFDQGRVWWLADSIGRCELTAELRCPKGHWYGQEFRMLQEINNLKVTDEETGEERFLFPPEKRRLGEILRPAEELSFAAIRKALWPKRKMSFRGFEETAQRKHLQGNAVEARFRAGPLREWYEALSLAEREELYDTLVETEIVEVHERPRCYGMAPAKLRHTAMARWGLVADDADEFARIADGLPGDHFRYSLSAIRKLLPHMDSGERNGLTVDKTILAAGFAAPGAGARDLLAPIDEVDPYLTNPLVHRALTEARKVVNAIIREYGNRS